MAADRILPAAPAELTSVLGELCRWDLLATIQGDAEASPDAIDALDDYPYLRGYGYLVADGEGWDTTIRERRASRWDGRMYGWDIRTLMLASATCRLSFKARAAEVPVAELTARDIPLAPPRYSEWHRKKLVYADVGSLVVNLNVDARSPYLTIVQTAYTGPSYNARTHGIARFQTTAVSSQEHGFEDGLEKIARVSADLLKMVTEPER